jgi:DNA-binding transcriptional ArsR family regulator
MRTLAPGVRRELADLSFLYRWTVPNCLLPAATTEYESFQAELARLRTLRTEVVAFELLRPLYDHGGGTRPARRRVLADPDVRTLALKRAGRLGARSRAAAALLFDDPRRFVDRFAGLLESYWDVAFAAEWERLEPLLAESVGAAGREIAAGGELAFLLRLAPQLRVEPAERAFGLDVPHEHRLTLTADNPLVLVPSVYVWPHVLVNCDGPWPLALVYRAPHLAESLRQPTAPELLRTLRALAHPTRLRILQQIALRPRSTQELAPLVGLSEAGTSKHLRLLAAAGVVETRREGYYVVYSLVPEQLDTLAGDVGHVVRSLSRSGARRARS